MGPFFEAYHESSGGQGEKGIYKHVLCGNGSCIMRW
jgi:hypothetical protein